MIRKPSGICSIKESHDPPDSIDTLVLKFPQEFRDRASVARSADLLDRWSRGEGIDLTRFVLEIDDHSVDQIAVDQIVRPCLH